MRWLERLSRFCALLAGTLVMLVVLMTCVSVVGRNLAGATLAGDFELTGLASGLAIAWFMPWCQWRRGHVVVDFFTSHASRRTNALLDQLGALLMGVIMALLGWRTTLGAISAWDNHSSSMLLGFPHWLVYAGMVPPLFLTAGIAAIQATGRVPNAGEGLPL